MAAKEPEAETKEIKKEKPAQTPAFHVGGGVCN